MYWRHNASLEPKSALIPQMLATGRTRAEEKSQAHLRRKGKGLATHRQCLPLVSSAAPPPPLEVKGEERSSTFLLRTHQGTSFSAGLGTNCAKDRKMVPATHTK